MLQVEVTGYESARCDKGALAIDMSDIHNIDSKYTWYFLMTKYLKVMRRRQHRQNSTAGFGKMPSGDGH